MLVEWPHWSSQAVVARQREVFAVQTRRFVLRTDTSLELSSTAVNNHLPDAFDTLGVDIPLLSEPRARS